MKRIFLSSIFLLSIISGSLFAKAIRATVKKTVPAKGIALVEVKATNGSIVVSTWNEDQILIIAHKKVDASKPKAREILDKIHIIVGQNGDALFIKAEKPDRSSSGLFGWLFGLGIKNFQVDYEITLPQRMVVKASSTNGDVEVDDVSGRLNLSTTNGSINALRIANTAEIHSTNGEIHVYYKNLPPKGDIEISTTNGEIELVLPKNPKCTLSAYTNNGEIDCNLPDIKSTSATHRYLESKINGGGAHFNVHTTNGDISIVNK